jgi:hypothetical protein
MIGIIEEIGDINPISGDMAGVLARWPIRYLGNWDFIQGWKDRMEAMSRYYFDLIYQEGNKYSYTDLLNQPYHYLWTDRDTNDWLPLYIVNTARAEDGTKGWVHPFSLNDSVRSENYWTSGIIDLTSYELKRQNKTKTTYISYPNAAFLPNRFPVLSPAAKIEGKGYFVDAGAVENSGLGTIYQMLNKMKSRINEPVFAKFFEKEIVVISFRNSRERFIESEFSNLVKDKLASPMYRGEIGANLNTVVNSGISGEPRALAHRFKEGEAKWITTNKDRVKSIHNYEINIPFRLTMNDIEAVYSRKIVDSMSVIMKIDSINHFINGYLCDHFEFVVEPPLSRLISRQAQRYMKEAAKFDYSQDAAECISTNHEAWKAIFK